MKDSPYKFLDFYDLKDREIFFGRESEINILVADILVSRLVVLFARTGTGKTSLINAGVRPLLESKKIKTFYMRVEQEPTEAAKSVLSKTDRAASLTTQLISAVDSSIDSTAGKPEKPVVLFLDQFEEFFLQIKSPETRQKFISYVAQIYKNPESGIHLVFSMREEYFYMMDEFRLEIPSIFHKNSNLRLMPLDEDQARDAIIKPAAARNVKLDLDLANRIIEDLQKQNDKDGIRAPSLQIICDTLWSREDPYDRHITLQDYDELGGAQNILDKRLAEALELALAGTGLIPLAQNLIDKLRTDENTKYPRLFSDLVETLGTGDTALRTLVDRLKGVRLIKDTTISNAPAIEWSSDYLAERTDLIKKILQTFELKEVFLQAWLEENLEKALARTGLIPLTQGLIDRLRTDENTKYPRLLSELVEKLDTDDTTLRKLIDRLKDAQVIKEATISNAPAIEWASDYLAKRTDLIKKVVETIELREAHQHALNADEKLQVGDSIGEPIETGEEIGELQDNIPVKQWRFGLDKFLELSSNPKSTENLQANEVEFLLDTALYYQQGNLAKDWFDRLATVNQNAHELLRKRIHNDEIDENVRKGLLVLIRELDPDTALPLLEEALDKPAVRNESIKTLIDYPMDRANELLARSLQREELWEDVVDALKGSGKRRAVALLIPLLQSDTKFSHALKALEKLAQSGGAVKDRATEALVSAIPSLQEKLKNELTVASAQKALIRLSRFPDPLGNMAQKTLNESTTVPTKDTELSKKKLSEKIKDLFVHNRLEESSEVQVKESPAGIDIPKAGSGLLRQRPKQERLTRSATDYFADIMPFINRGTLIPIIGNSFRLEQVFRSEQELADQLSDAADIDHDELTIGEQLTRAWADEIRYPMRDVHNLARVAQYYQVEQRETLLAKAKYLKFLTNFLLDISEEEDEYKEAVRQLRTRDALFSDIVHSLDYPRFPPDIEDPLRVLARLPLSLYVTTGYYNFLERALEAEAKKPRTQVCFWTGGKSRAKPEHIPDPLYEPSQLEPVVYHLFGLEDYPQTLVLSEDDFLNFLISVVEDTNTQNPLVPLRLREGLAESRLLLLGYNVEDWEYRVLFRFISKYRSLDFAPRGMLIQSQRGMKQIEDEERLIKYFEQYFDRNQFEMKWTSPERFIRDLWNEWNKYRMGEA